MSDLDYINFIRKGDNRVVAQLYNRLRPQVIGYLRRNRALSDDDCQDIFQDSIVCLVSNARKDGFSLSCRLETYIIAISKNIASNHLRKDSKVMPIDNGTESFDVIDVMPSDDDIELRLEKEEEVSTFRAIFRQMGDSCRRLLTAFYFEDKSYREITETLGVYTNEDSAKTAKNKCITKMRSVYSQLRP